MSYSRSERDFLKTFGTRVRRVREDKKLTQEQLAFLSGLHRTYVGAVERGERNIGLLNLRKLVEALDCQISDLLRL